MASDGDVRQNISSAEAARAARLHELRTAAALVVTVGMYYKARARSTAATCATSTLGFLGIIGVIAAVAWPVSG